MKNFIYFLFIFIFLLLLFILSIAGAGYLAVTVFNIPFDYGCGIWLIFILFFLIFSEKE